MVIKNITDKAGNAPKVIGFGGMFVLPGESIQIPDRIAYCDEYDEDGNKTGRKVVLPGILAQAKIGMLTYEETKAAEAKPAKTEAPVEAEPVAEPPAENTPEAEKKPARGGRSKKAE